MNKSPMTKAIGLLMGLVVIFIAPAAHADIVTKTIGTISRDYSTIQLWEDDLDDGTNAANDATAYSASDDAVGEMYDDSDFTTGTVINGGVTINLGSITLTAPVGERHTGTEATGVEIDCNVGNAIVWDVLDSENINGVIEWLDMTCNSPSTDGYGIRAMENTSQVTVKGNIIRDVTSGNAWNNATGINTAYGALTSYIFNNIFYNIKPTGSGSTGDAYGISIANTSIIEVYNNTVFKVENDNDIAVGMDASDTTHTTKNNIVMDTGGSGGGTIQDFLFAGATPDSDYNLSSDETADDGGGASNRLGSDHSQAGSDMFVSTAAGLEDLRLKSGADAINKGTDLGTIPTGINFDIENRDRDAQGDTWDIGADEFVSGVGWAIKAGNLRFQGGYTIK